MYHLFFANPIAAKYQTQETTLRQILGHIFYGCRRRYSLRKYFDNRCEKDYQKTKNLMKKYADLPMDYADATIVCLATETRIQNVITFDRKDFAIYKLPKKQSFTIMP